MTTTVKPFRYGELVIWKTPQEREHWGGERIRQVRRHGAGPFTIESIFVRDGWNVTLLNTEGQQLFHQERLATFPACWLKKYEPETPDA